MASVASRTRAKPTQRLLFGRPRTQVCGKLLVTFDDLGEPMKLSWEEASKQLHLRERAQELVSEKYGSDALGPSPARMDYVLFSDGGTPIIVVNCTREVVSELQFVVLVLLERLRVRGAFGFSSTQKNARQRKKSATGTRKVSTKSQEQGSPPRSLTDSGITTTSGGGGCGGAPVARPIEDLHLAPGSISLRPAGDEDISTTQDTAEISSIPVEQAFPHLCHAVALIGSSSQSPTAPSSGINIFDFDMPLPYSAGGDGDGNPFGLSAAMLSEVSCLCSSDTVVVFTGNNDIDDKAAGFIDDMSLELVDEEVGADQRLAQISGMNPSHNFVI